MRLGELFRQIALSIQKLHARYQHSRGGIRFFDDYFSGRLLLEASQPRFHSPNRIYSLCLEKAQLIGILRGNHVCISAQLSDF